MPFPVIHPFTPAPPLIFSQYDPFVTELGNTNEPLAFADTLPLYVLPVYKLNFTGDAEVAPDNALRFSVGLPAFK